MPSSAVDPVESVRGRTRAILEAARLVRSRRRVVVAVSGGADSVCLLDVLIHTLPGAPRRLIVGHVDHQLRPESGEDAEYVRRQAEAYGLACEVIAADVPGLAKARKIGVEEAARLARYSALAGLAARQRASVVATGHTRDDHVETVLLHLVRGSGRRGLAGLSAYERLGRDLLGAVALSEAEAADLTLLRPLLEVSRDETVAYCAARDIRWRNDPTNADPRFLRNRVRHHLLPVLRTYNPSFERSVERLAAVVREEEDWIERAVARRWSRLERRVDGRPAVNLDAWTRQPLALRRRLVRLVAARCGRRELGFEAVERALAIGEAGGPARAELGQGLVAYRSGGMLVFEAAPPGTPA